MRQLTFKEAEGESIRNFTCTQVLKIYFHAKVDTATIHQGLPVPPATHQQVSNAGCNGIYAGSSLQCRLDFGHDNNHSEALKQLFRSKTKAISPFDRKGK